MCLPLLLSGSSLSLLAWKGMLGRATGSAGCVVAIGLLWAEFVSLPKVLAGGAGMPAATVMLL
jgi:hypothetical protein